MNFLGNILDITADLVDLLGDLGQTVVMLGCYLAADMMNLVETWLNWYDVDYFVVNYLSTEANLDPTWRDLHFSILGDLLEAREYIYWTIRFRIQDAYTALS
jgi:hypothetical protein